jgi:hypothetical protein
MEQFVGQVGGQRKRPAHAFGMEQEAIFSGWTRGAQTTRRSANGLYREELRQLVDLRMGSIR